MMTGPPKSMFSVLFLLVVFLLYCCHFYNYIINNHVTPNVELCDMGWLIVATVAGLFTRGSRLKNRCGFGHIFIWLPLNPANCHQHKHLFTDLIRI